MARPGGALKTERDVLGNTRIDFVSHQARALGVRPGQTVAAARAKCALLHTSVIAEGVVSSALARIAEAALAFGPTTAFDVAQDVVWVDVGGCAHLHGGEVELARALAARVRVLGHACRVAVADGPRLAAAVARFSKSDVQPFVVPQGKGDVAVRSLPIGALALDQEVCVWLAELGLTVCGDLQKLPRRSLGARLGRRAYDVMKLLDGHDDAPLDPWRPPEVPEERVEFDWGVHSIEALAFVLKTLCARLAARLAGRAMAAARLELVLTLDRALCEQVGSSSHRTVLPMVLPSPIARAADLLAVVRTRIERCSLAAPVLAVTLRAPELAQAVSRTLELLAPEPKAEQRLPRLVAELAAEMGEDRVGTLALVDTWSPDERTCLLPFGDAGRKSRYSLVTAAVEPSRLVQPKQVSNEVLVGARHVARIDAVQWWKPRRAGVAPRTPQRTAERRESATRQTSQPFRRDLFVAWVDDGLSWLERRDCDDHPLLRGWVD